MDKKKVWLILGILIPVLITATIFIITLAIGGSGETETDSSWIPFGSSFILFILPVIIAQQKKRRKQKEMNN